jgi:methionyl aminopeptidase
MSYIKTKEEIKQITEGGKLMGEILEKLAIMVRPGASAWEIDQQAEKMIREVGGRPAFLGYQPRHTDVPFPSTICACLNDELVHGIATKEKILNESDIFSIDIGMEYPFKGNEEIGKLRNEGNGFYTDTALTIPVGEISGKKQKLLEVTQKSLEEGIKQCKPGNTIADIGRAIEDYVKSQGDYGIVRDLVGHGVGHKPHEEPAVPNFYDKSMESWVLEPGVVIAVEPMITLGGYEIVADNDKWTIRTKDGSLNAHFEHTIVITEGEPDVVTRRPSEL